MKYKIGDELYYVNPFIYTIDKVSIEFIEEDNQQGIVYYIDYTGGYLAEHDLFEHLDQAKMWAIARLEEFYIYKMHEIGHANPQLDFEEGD